VDKKYYIESGTMEKHLMKAILNLIFILILTNAVGQNFKFTYGEYDLHPGRNTHLSSIITIEDSILTSFEFEFDTMWEKKISGKFPFRVASRDSILKLLNGKEGKLFYIADFNIRGGNLRQLYFEYKDWCVEIDLANTFDSTAMHIINIINTYIPSDKKIRIPYEMWIGRPSSTNIKSCQKHAKCIDTTFIDFEGKKVVGKFCNGKKEGEWTWYYKNGRKNRILHFVNDTLNGNYMDWHPNGNILGWGSYKNNQLEGLFISYRPTGIIEMKGTMKNGNQEGEGFMYDEKGKLVSKGHFKNGLKEGEFFRYDENGKIIETLVFKNDVLIKTEKSNN
jgi:hypothetical protein